jgi:hypothetical protein
MSNADVAALVRAIRKAHEGEQYGAGVTHFTVLNIFAFAEKLVREGVTVQQKEAA